jgi:RNA polymerase sigma-70 factor (ECF subfamily)
VSSPSASCKSTPFIWESTKCIRKFAGSSWEPDSTGETVTIAPSDPSSSYLRQEVEGWFHELRDPLFRYLRTLGCEHWLAEEIAQEAFLRLLAARRDGTEVKDVRAWVFRVARNLTIDIRREHQRYWTDAPGKKTHNDPAPNPEQRLIRHERLRRISEELSHLPKLQQECMRLKAQGLRYHEIAAALGISMTAAVDHARRALARLRKLFRQAPPHI